MGTVVRRVVRREGGKSRQRKLKRGKTDQNYFVFRTVAVLPIGPAQQAAQSAATSRKIHTDKEREGERRKGDGGTYNSFGVRKKNHVYTVL